MRLRDFCLLVIICMVWALNTVMNKLVVGEWHVPPLFFAASRFAVVLLAVIPWLLPIPRPLGRVVLIGLLMGGINFGMLFVAMQYVSPSVAAVVVQAGVPFTALLSVLMLGERIHWRRGVGLALTMGGVLIIAWNPGATELSWGAALLLAAAFVMALGTVMAKQVENVSPLRFQAWVALPSLPLLLLGTALFEQDQYAIAVGLGWRFLIVAVFAGLAVSVFAHTVYLWLLRRYEANLIAPLTLMNPLMTFGLGALLTGDRFGTRMIVGTALALLGVLIVVLRARPLTEILARRDLA